VNLGFRKSAQMSERNHRIIKLQSILFSLVLCGAFFTLPAKADAAKAASGAVSASSVGIAYGNSLYRNSQVVAVAQLTPAATSNGAPSPASAPAPESLSLFLAGCLSLLAYAGVRRIHNYTIHRHKQIH
jgi:hypothetical protein